MFQDLVRSIGAVKQKAHGLHREPPSSSLYRELTSILHTAAYHRQGRLSIFWKQPKGVKNNLKQTDELLAERYRLKAPRGIKPNPVTKTASPTGAKFDCEE
jgi:hypothetical protein